MKKIRNTAKHDDIVDATETDLCLVRLRLPVVVRHQ